MLDLYSWATPNGHKVHIMLEELGVPWRVHPVDIGAGEQFHPDFLAISPNNKIPVLVDSDPVGSEGTEPFAIFESGAILHYLACKYDRFFPHDARAQSRVMQWLMFQMAGLGPMLGQTHHFRVFAPEKVPYAIERYSTESRRLYGVMNSRLEQSQWLAGPAYSIADIAAFPWIRSHEKQGIDLADFPHVQSWFDEIAARPAVKAGLKILSK